MIRVNLLTEAKAAAARRRTPILPTGAKLNNVLFFGGLALGVLYIGVVGLMLTSRRSQLEDEIVNELFAGHAARLVQRLWRKDKLVPRWLGALLFGLAQRTAERHHARTRRELLRVDDHLSDLLAFTGRPE